MQFFDDGLFINEIFLDVNRPAKEFFLKYTNISQK